MPVEAAHIIATCENRLLAAKIIDHPFSADEIHGGMLKEHLTMEDYRAPLEVSISPSYLILSFTTFKLVVIHVAKGKTKFVPKQITHTFEMTEELTIHDI